MGLEDSSRGADAPAKDDAQASSPAPTPAAAVEPDAEARKKREAEAARGRLRRAQEKLKAAKDEQSLKKAAAEIAGVQAAASKAAVAPTLTAEQVSAELQLALKQTAPALTMVAGQRDEVWADVCRSVAEALGDARGKALCDGWAPLLVMLFPNGLNNPYAAAILSTLIFSAGVGIQTALVRHARAEATQKP